MEQLITLHDVSLKSEGYVQDQKRSRVMESFYSVSMERNDKASDRREGAFIADWVILRLLSQEERQHQLSQQAPENDICLH